MNDDQHTIVLRFADESPAEANLAAQRLSEFIAAEAASIPGSPPVISSRKDQGSTLDLGSTLVLAFGTPFAIAIARGIAAYIGALGSRVLIETPDGKVIASGDGAKNIDVAKTVGALQSRAASKPATVSSSTLPSAKTKAKLRTGGKSASSRKAK